MSAGQTKQGRVLQAEGTACAKLKGGIHIQVQVGTGTSVRSGCGVQPRKM